MEGGGGEGLLGPGVTRVTQCIHVAEWSGGTEVRVWTRSRGILKGVMGVRVESCNR